MATFESIPYTYVPTPLRSKSTTAQCVIPSKPLSKLDKNQRIKPSSAVLEKPRPLAVVAAVNDVRDERLRIQDNLAETGIIYSDNNKENNNDDYFLTIEEILCTALHEEGFATEDSKLDYTAQGVDNVAIEETSSSVDHSRLTPDNGLGTSKSNPIFLGEDESDASKCETDYSRHRSESAEPDTVLFSTTETAFDSRSSVHPSYLEASTKTAEHLQLAKEEALASNAMRQYGPSSRPLSEPLHNHSRADDLCTSRTRFEASISHYSRPQSQPLYRARASPQYKPSQEDHLLTSGCASNEGELYENNVDKEQDIDINDTYQEVNNAAAAQMAKKGSNTHLSSKEDERVMPAKRQRPLSSHDSLSQSNQEGIGSNSDSCSEGEISNTRTKSDKEQRRLRPSKRKQPSSSYEGIPQKKQRHHLQQRSTRQSKLRSGSQRHCAESVLPSPAPSTPQALDTELPSDFCTVGRSSRDTQPMLTEITFRPHSLYECSFTAVIQADHGEPVFSFGQAAKLIENIGYVGKIDDFTIKPLTQNSLLLVGFSGTMGTGLKASCMHRGATGIQLQDSKAVDAKATTLCKGELLCTEDDDVLSDSDLDLSSSDDDRSSTEDEQGRSSIRKHSKWSLLDEQRLLAYRKEGKSWSWIFYKFPSRTPGAVRTRYHIAQARLPEWHGNENDKEVADVADEAKPKRERGRPPKKK